MTLKSQTRPLPKLVMKEWPERNIMVGDYAYYIDLDGSVKAIAVRGPVVDPKALSDFTRVVEETGILDQERSQKADTPPRR